MASASEGDRPIPTAEEEELRKESRTEWLISIKDAATRQQQAKRRMHKVPETLKSIWKEKNYFDPSMVSLGPYHRGKDHLKLMEEQKLVAAQSFVSNSPHRIESVYAKVREVARETRECYDDNAKMDDEDFGRMMFLDGCFILHIIDCIVHHRKEELTMRPHVLGFVVRDMFLLENQIPFLVLEELMILNKSMSIEVIDKFLAKIVKTPDVPLPLATWLGRMVSRLRRMRHKKDGDGAAGDRPFHMLHGLRAKHLRHPEEEDDEEAGVTAQYEWHSFRSVTELKAAGIKFRRSATDSLRDVKFNRGIVHGILSLPPIVINHSTKHWLLNLIAYELSPDGPSDYGITSYICLLDSLIDRPDDVEVLRKKKILLNGLGSDEEVAHLFNLVANDLAPDPTAYAKVLDDIETHCKSRCRVHFANLIYTHFKTPWTIVSFTAAVVIILLTMVGTFFTIFPRK